MPGTVRSLIVGGGLAVGAPATVGTIPVFSGATPPDEVIDSIIVQSSTTEVTVGGDIRFGNVAATRQMRMSVMNQGANGGLAILNVGSTAFQNVGWNGGVIIGKPQTTTIPDSVFACVAIGDGHILGTTTNRNFYIVGDGCSVNGPGQKCYLFGRGLANASGVGVIMIGADASTSGAVNDCIILKAEAGASTCTVGHSDSIVIGGASTTSANQILLGGGNLLSHYLIFGQGPTGVGTVLTTDKEFHPTDAATGSNLATNPFRIRGMRPTGNAVGGSLIFESFTPLGSGTTSQTIVPVLTIQQTSGAAGQAGVRFDTVTSGAAAAVGTLNNAPAAGDPTFWLPVDIAGTVRYIPCW